MTDQLALDGIPPARPKGNRSSAVIQKRQAPRKEAIDYFPTPPWATEALIERLEWLGERLHDKSCLEPAAGGGHMAAVLERHFAHVTSHDLHDPAGAGYPRRDFLADDETAPYDWIITNPPYILAERFVERGIARSRVGTAFLCRTAFLEGEGRYTRLFTQTPPTEIAVFSSRVLMAPGKLGDPKEDRGLRQSSYAWFIWRHPRPAAGLLGPAWGRTRMLWIAPHKD